MSVSGKIFAAAYDHMMAGSEKAGLSAHRAGLLGSATGRVLEIGGGTGANLPFYNGVDALVVTEPEEPMARRLEHRAAERELPLELVQAPAEELPFDDASFDTAVSTLVLCTVSDQPRALGELRRVLKPGGRLLFMEHVRADTARLARWQDRLHGFHRVIGHGCNCNLTTLQSIRDAGFEVQAVERDEIQKAPPWVRPLVVGTAVSA